MPGPEQPPAPEVSLTRAEKEKLLQQMYSLPHWIAVIRLFGYQTLAMDKAREAIKPIADQHGKPVVADACEVLVEILNEGKMPVARLKAHIRRMAFQILGPEPEQALAAPPAPAPITPAPAAASAAKKSRAKPRPDADGRPVKQPRHHVLKQSEAWLNEAKLFFVAINDVKRTTPAVAPHAARPRTRRGMPARGT